MKGPAPARVALHHLASAALVAHSGPVQQATDSIDHAAMPPQCSAANGLSPPAPGIDAAAGTATQAAARARALAQHKAQSGTQLSMLSTTLEAGTNRDDAGVLIDPEAAACPPQCSALDGRA